MLSKRAKMRLKDLSASKLSTKRTHIAELKLDQDLSPKTKKAKFPESTKGLMAKIQQFAKAKERLGGLLLGNAPSGQERKISLRIL